MLELELKLKLCDPLLYSARIMLLRDGASTLCGRVLHNSQARRTIIQLYLRDLRHLDMLLLQITQDLRKMLIGTARRGYPIR